jgi:hypothetical protein
MTDSGGNGCAVVDPSKLVLASDGMLWSSFDFVARGGFLCEKDLHFLGHLSPNRKTLHNILVSLLSLVT